ncbi:MAG: hypothetical protein WBF53_14305 [Litorimonas sp.]
MKRISVFGLLIVLAACAPETPDMTGSAQVQATAPEALSLFVEDGGDGPWAMEIVLPEPDPVLFPRSNGAYREGSFSAHSDGVRLERIEGFDAILLPEGERRGRFEFVPYTDYIHAEYTPFLPFSDGGVAMFTGQFELLPADSREAIAALNGDLDGWTGRQLPVELTLRSPRTMLIGGEAIEGEATVRVDGNGQYVYFGDATLTEGASFVGVLDPGLPDWLGSGLDDRLSVIFAALEDRFGFALKERATILFAFGGYDTPGLSNSGGVLPGNVLALETEGAALRDPDAQILQRFQRFLAHEAVHLFQAMGGKSAASPDLAWIHEGGADAMSGQLLVELGFWEREARARYLAADLERCVAALSGSTLSETIRESRIGAYDCGEIIAVASDAALPGHDLYDLWATLVSQADGESDYAAADYFAAMASLGADESWLARLRTLVSDRATDPKQEFLDLMEAVGIEANVKDGTVQSVTYPG